MILASIYDNKADTWTPPCVFHTKADALRAFTLAVTQTDSQIARHPEDFTLYCLGTWDPVLGAIQLLLYKENLATAAGAKANYEAHAQRLRHQDEAAREKEAAVVNLEEARIAAGQEK